MSIASCTSPFASASTDRKSTRLNSSHLVISYAVFCLKKKNDAISSPGIGSLLTPPFDKRHPVHQDIAQPRPAPRSRVLHFVGAWCLLVFGSLAVTVPR